MKQREIYKTIKDYALANSITADQVKTATRQQIENLFGVDLGNYSNKFLGTLKGNLIDELNDMAEETRAVQAQVVLRTELGLPDLIVEKQFTTDKPLYFVWPKGKPVVAGDDE